MPTPVRNLRRTGPGDMKLLWHWANDPLTRQNSFDRRPILLADHERWFAAKIASPDARMWMLDEGPRPVAQVRYDRHGAMAEVDVTVAPSERGRGIGAEILSRSARPACDELRVEHLVALVLPNNVASLRAFERAGYVLRGKERRGGVEAIRLERSCRDLSVAP